jgi:hypothetical protein
MFNIDNDNRISVTRGDSFSVPLFLNIGTDLEPVLYRLQKRDCLYLAVTEPNQPFECAIVKKVITEKDMNEDGTVNVRFKSKDTECLLPGKYYYQVKARFATNDDEEYTINTVVPETEFIIMK